LLSEPYLSVEDYAASENKSIMTDDYVVDLICLNSSMWVCEPFIPCKGEKKRSIVLLYYHCNVSQDTQKNLYQLHHITFYRR